MSTDEPTLRRRIDAVDDVESTEDDLVTLAVPPESAIEEVRTRIEEEHARTQYLDSGPTRQSLRQAIETVRRLLREYEGVPENGLVIYAGVVDGDPVEYVFDDLPDPVPEFVFDCDNEFDTDPLEAVAESSGTYGLIVVERGEAAIGRLEGGTVEHLESFESGVPGKTRAGGQSADRFERRREERKADFFGSVAEEAERAFLGEDPVDGVLLGGSTVTVEEFRDGDFLDHRLRDRILETVAVEYATERGLHQLVESVDERVLDDVQREARDALDRFLDRIGEGDEEVVYGREETERTLTYEALGTLLVSDALDPETARGFEERAEEIGAERVVVPTDIERGKQFREAFGGVGGFLRFPIE